MLARMSPVLPLEVDGKLIDDAPAKLDGLKAPENPICQRDNMGHLDVGFSRDSWGLELITY